MSESKGEVRAAELARLVADGKTLAEATTILEMDADEAKEIVTSDDWVSLVRSYHKSDDEVRDEFASLIPLAIKVKREVLTSETTSPALKDRVASDILNRLGYEKVGQRQLPSMAVPNADVVRAVFVEIFKKNDD